jgi:hypothetical protein
MSAFRTKSISRCSFDPTYWDTYLTVNRRFAETELAARTSQLATARSAEEESADV